MKLTFNRVVRRTHLYLALVCLPWFVMYGISALAFSHGAWFQGEDGGRISWQEAGSWPCTLPMPEAVEREDLHRLLDAAGMGDRTMFGGSRRGDTVNIYFPAFWTMERVEYRINQQTLTHFTAEKSLQHILTSMHVRGRYVHENVLSDLWGVMVDLTAIGFVLWVVTGLILWWKIKSMRIWGGLSLGAGCAAFVAFMLLL